MATTTTTSKDFVSLGIDKWLVDSLSAMAIRKPTPIQAACIQPILEGPSPRQAQEGRY
jgi:superfamily II DNA/RNA helicase